MATMAKLIHEVMFHEDKTPGYTSMEIAVLNFGLQDVLGSLEPGSDTYMACAKTFHDEVAQVASRESLFSKLNLDYLRRIH
jgi:hypothetical protein